ncbi:hypothetical protein CKO15_06935 [Halorhodospira abdelmalekii]|uniref:winged helix-turn-helix domain-containing protein n=1 Tax=Halorhodospira abdelmalekii TaxID=421629 RepID=UPI0030842EC2|nr:hypothetical protein [Halorhodospira abdelmalekii]
MQPEIEGQFWFKLQGKPFLGGARIQLLEQVAATGSISAAARAIGMSYKAARDAIDAMNNLSDQPDEGWRLTQGAEACALIKASHVLLAVTD